MKPLAPIPAHTNCQNCGDCCGPLPIGDKEFASISAYVAKHPEAQAVAEKPKSEPLVCVFRDEQNHRCAVYPVRPLICRLMGVCDGMECSHGNSATIDGYAYIAGYKPGPIRNLQNGGEDVEG